MNLFKSKQKVDVVWECPYGCGNIEKHAAEKCPRIKKIKYATLSTSYGPLSIINEVEFSGPPYELLVAINLLRDALSDREEANWSMGTDWVDSVDRFLANYKEKEDGHV
jgi:hypothetical protein